MHLRTWRDNFIDVVERFKKYQDDTAAEEAKQKLLRAPASAKDRVLSSFRRIAGMKKDVRDQSARAGLQAVAAAVRWVGLKYARAHMFWRCFTANPTAGPSHSHTPTRVQYLYFKAFQLVFFFFFFCISRYDKNTFLFFSIQKPRLQTCTQSNCNSSNSASCERWCRRGSLPRGYFHRRRTHHHASHDVFPVPGGDHLVLL